MKPRLLPLLPSLYRLLKNPLHPLSSLHPFLTLLGLPWLKPLRRQLLPGLRLKQGPQQLKQAPMVSQSKQRKSVNPKLLGPNLPPAMAGERGAGRGVPQKQVRVSWKVPP